MKANARYIAVLILIVVTGFIWTVTLEEESRGELTVSFLDVGQGDAVFIESPAGVQLLIDGGVSGPRVLRELGKVMPFYDRSIDVVLATHPDKDHIGGLPAVFDSFEIGMFMEPGIQVETAIYGTLQQKVLEEGSELVFVKRGMEVPLGEGVTLTILFPDRDVSHEDPNDGSVIAQLVYGETEFLFTGDAPSSVENYLVGIDGERLESDVLKVGHHGSKTSSSALFVGQVNPVAAVVSAGYDNRYGHPHEEVVGVYEQFEIPVFGTYDEGIITFVSDGYDITRK